MSLSKLLRFQDTALACFENATCEAPRRGTKVWKWGQQSDLSQHICSLGPCFPMGNPPTGWTSCKTTPKEHPIWTLSLPVCGAGGSMVRCSLPRTPDATKYYPCGRVDIVTQPPVGTHTGVSFFRGGPKWVGFPFGFPLKPPRTGSLKKGHTHFSSSLAVRATGFPLRRWSIQAAALPLWEGRKREVDVGSLHPVSPSAKDHEKPGFGQRKS